MRGQFYRVKKNADSPFKGRKMKYVCHLDGKIMLELLTRKVGVFITCENGVTEGDMKSWEKGETFGFTPEQVEEID